MLELIHRAIGGTSPITGYFGSIVIVLDVAQQALVQGGVPHDLQGWMAFGSLLFTGLGLRFAKDANKSNAVNPAAVAQTVRVLLVPVLLFGLAACSDKNLQANTSKINAVAVKVSADVHRVLVAGCANQPAVEVAIELVLEFLPEGSTTDEVNKYVGVAEKAIGPLCARVAEREGGGS